ncbi:MAG: hypothetical protein KIT11_06865 [Fimbriimonadaceae bacterium]|nr:hypothetical protein [Fimbriimonadaceae bacterium]QYK56073.1 MAG: hypothetical protein KF733_01055 [Fimbriimonadaceae bacterium]
MRVLTVPNWSFGRDRRLLWACREALDSWQVKVHYCESDVDHNRTVTAFSGEQEVVEAVLYDLAHLVLPTIDLNRHVGVHPRIGGLDVCPFTPLEPIGGEDGRSRFLQWVESVASGLAEKFDLPVFLYEKSEKGRHEADLPGLRKGGFGGLLERELRPDYGPSRAHPLLGATVVGWRDFLIAMNANLKSSEPVAAKTIAASIRRLRSEGDPRFLGVRALGFPLASREASQVSMNVTLPDLTPVDPILEFIETMAGEMTVPPGFDELIGVIREADLPGATRLHPRPEQVV